MYHPNVPRMQGTRGAWSPGISSRGRRPPGGVEGEEDSDRDSGGAYSAALNSLLALLSLPFPSRVGVPSTEGLPSNVLTCPAQETRTTLVEANLCPAPQVPPKGATRKDAFISASNH